MKKQRNSKTTLVRVAEIKSGRKYARFIGRKRFCTIENPESIIAKNFEQIAITTKELYEREIKETRIAVMSEKLSIKELKSKYAKYK